MSDITENHASSQSPLSRAWLRQLLKGETQVKKTPVGATMPSTTARQPADSWSAGASNQVNPWPIYICCPLSSFALQVAHNNLGDENEQCQVRKEELTGALNQLDQYRAEQVRSQIEKAQLRRELAVALHQSERANQVGADFISGISCLDRP